MLMRQNFDPVWSKLSSATTSRERPPRLDILGGRLREVQLYFDFVKKTSFFTETLSCSDYLTFFLNYQGLPWLVLISQIGNS